MRNFSNYSWPRNVRELQQVIKSTLLEVGGKNICLEDFAQRIKARNNGDDLSDNTHSSPSRGPGISEREIRVLDLIREKRQIKRKDVEEALGCGTTVAYEILKEMILKGMIKREGKGRNLIYVSYDGL